MFTKSGVLNHTYEALESDWNCDMVAGAVRFREKYDRNPAGREAKWKRLFYDGNGWGHHPYWS